MTLRKNKFYLLVCIGTFLSACMKEEIAVPKHEPGEVQTNEIELGEDYRHQLYFNLASNQVVKSNLKTAWDLAFESNGEHVVLNTAKGMAVHQSVLSFEDINSEDDLDWRWDAHSGNLDSTAIGNWQTDDFVYVIDRGYDWLGDHQGYFKLVILSANESEYEIGYGDISSTIPTYYTLERSATEQFIYFQFESGQVTIAPADGEFDFIFTQYTHLFKDPVTPYVVTGIILNRGYTAVARLDEKPFDEIQLEDAEELNFSYEIDEIGYDWKYYSLEDGVFTTHMHQHYIIRTQLGVFYKLRIIGFYNAEGIKGYPTIEFNAL